MFKQVVDANANTNLEINKGPLDFLSPLTLPNTVKMKKYSNDTPVLLLDNTSSILTSCILEPLGGTKTGRGKSLFCLHVLMGGIPIRVQAFGYGA